jgi:probable HAF family extracellular repeat protein
MTDLGTLPGDLSSSPSGLNDNGQIVGASQDASGNSRAFLWQHGTMTDLNTLIPVDFQLFLIFGGSINSRVEITGVALLKETAEFHAFLPTRVAEIASRVAIATIRFGIHLPRELRPASRRR